MSKMSEEGLVSVIIPTFNRAALVSDAIRSAVSQSYRKLDIIVVNDGSTDETTQVLAGFGSQIRVIHQPNAGPSAARNAGLRNATGEYVSFLDSDDVYGLDKVATQMLTPPGPDEILFAKQSFCAAAGNRQLLTRIIGPGIKWPATDSEGWLIDPVQQLAEGRYLQLNTMMCRRGTFETIGPFDERFSAGEDEDWFFRAAFVARIRLDEQALAVRRIHESQTGLQSERSLLSLIEVLDGMRERARAAGHDSAVRSLSQRLSNQLVRLARHRAANGHRSAAIALVWRAFLQNPRAFKRLAKIPLYGVGWKPKPERR